MFDGKVLVREDALIFDGKFLLREDSLIFDDKVLLREDSLIFDDKVLLREDLLLTYSSISSKKSSRKYCVFLRKLLLSPPVRNLMLSDFNLGNMRLILAKYEL